MCKSVSPWSAWAPKVVESVRVNIGIPVVQRDGRAYGHMITKFSRMGRLPHFLSYGGPSTSARRARVELRYKILENKRSMTSEFMYTVTVPLIKTKTKFFNLIGYRQA